MSLAAQSIEIILLGGLLGLLGQIIRMSVGLKKLHDQAKESGRKMKDVFQASSLVVSLLIGFAAGALALLVPENPELKQVVAEGQAADLPLKLVLGVMAAGYAGTDFVEGFAKRLLPGRGTSHDPVDGMREPDLELPPPPRSPAIG